jgi:hypothetical protein
MDALRLPVFLMVLLALAGCESPDPLAGSHEPLAVGSEVLVYRDTRYGVPGNDDPNKIRVTFPDYKRHAIGLELIPVGTKVRVVDDPEGDKFKRPVKVMMLEGEFSGELGTIPRENLKLVAK